MSGIGIFAQRTEALRGSQKPKRGAPAYTLFVNRGLGRVLAAATPTAVTPNGLTVLSAAATVAASAILWVVDERSFAAWLVAPLLVLGYALDSADGQVSRLRGLSSAFGEWLDHALDAGKLVLLHISLIAYLIRTTDLGSTALLAVLVAYLVPAILIYVGGLLVGRLSLGGDAPRPFGRTDYLRSFLMLPVDYGVLCVATFAVSFPVVFWWIYVVLAGAHVLFLIAYFKKWAGDLRHYDAVRLEQSEVKGR